MENQKLTCLFFPDLLPWERQSLSPLLAHMATRYRLEQFDVNALDRNRLRELRKTGNLWVVANRWQQALRFLSVPTKARAFVSVLGPVSAPDSLSTLFLRRFRPFVSRSAHLIAHSPLSYRFLREIQHVPESQVSFAPLPYHPDLRTRLASTRGDGALTVATLARFSSESNLNYFLSVAHYVTKRNPALRFRILGAGLLAPHVQELVRGLDLSEQVRVEICRDGFDLSDVDLFLYTPLQNEHFIPLIQAGSRGIPIVACEIPGIDQFIVDGRDGFLVAVNDIRPMGELVLRLAADPQLRESVARNLADRLERKFSSDAICGAYESLFFGKAPAKASLAEAAA